MDKKILKFQKQQEDADKKQAAFDRKQIALNKKIATLEKGYSTIFAELSLLKIRLNSEMQVESSIATSSAKKPSDLESTVQLNSLVTIAQSEDTATDGAKRADSSNSDEAGKDEESSSEDDDFEAIQKVLGNKK